MCTCITGYTGDGVTCTGIVRGQLDYCHSFTTIIIDIDECAEMSNNCDDSLATCTNTAGSFMCTCITGYTGDGVTCAGRVTV